MPRKHDSSPRWLVWSLVLGICIAAWAVADQYAYKCWIFDPQVLHSVAKEALARQTPVNETMLYIQRALAKRYPGHVAEDQEWMYNIAGGAMGGMTILHASITEYLIFFGTTVGTEGHTGRHLADDYFIIIDGEQWTYSAGEFTKRIFRPGDMNLMPRWEARQYRMPDQAFALEYARGWIPSMVPFGTFDVFFSTLDFIALGQLVRVYSGHLFRELLQGKV